MKLVVRKGLGALVAALVLVCAFALPGAAMAEDLGGIGDTTTQQYDNTQNRSYDNNGSNGLTNENGRNPVQQFKDNLPNNNDGSGITDYLNGYNPVDRDSMNRAQSVVSPLANVIKTIISVILVALPVILFLVSAVDMVYLTVPFSRSLLCPGGQESMSSMSGGMGGYGAGYGAGMGGYGAGYGAGMGAQMTGSSGRKFISDDAEQALQEAQAASAGAANSSMGMQAGYGGMQQAKPAKTKSPLMIYMKKRVWMYVVFGLSLVLLFSNVWLQWGAGLANWIVSLIS